MIRARPNDFDSLSLVGKLGASNHKVSKELYVAHLSND